MHKAFENNISATNIVLTKTNGQFMFLVTVQGAVIVNDSREEIYDVVAVELKEEN